MIIFIVLNFEMILKKIIILLNLSKHGWKNITKSTLSFLMRKNVL